MSKIDHPRAETIAPLHEAQEAWRRAYIDRALAICDGSRTRAAAMLGVDVRTIFRHIAEQGRQG